MSIEEISDYFEDRNVEKSRKILEAYQKKFEAELMEMQRLNDELRSKVDFLKSLDELPEIEEVFEVDIPTRYMVTFGEKSGDRERHAMVYTELENYIYEKIPILASDRVGIYADQTLLIPNDELIPAVPMLLVSPEGAAREYLREIPDGRYVCMYYRNGILEKYDPSFERVKDYLREHEYEICGDILQLYKVDVTLTDDPWETILELQVPVKKMDS